MNRRPVIIVTGASQGVGASVARWLAKVGAAVTLVARTGKALNQVAADVVSLGGNSLIVPADIASPEACRDITARTINRFGRLDALVNNAGILEPLEKISRSGPDAWRYNIEVNLLGAVFMSMAALAELRLRGGRIVNVSSGAAQHVIAAASAYCAAKAGLNQFTRVLAAEEPEITAVAIRPGVVDTKMQALLRQKGPGKMPADQAAYYQDLKTEGRLEPPEVPARAIAWLALHTPTEWSGAYMNYDDPQISSPAKEVFGASLGMNTNTLYNLTPRRKDAKLKNNGDNTMEAKTREIMDRFEQINSIPRCSKNEEKISQWLQQWASKHNFKVHKDSTGNLCVKVPASAGAEDAPVIVIQGHMDMVCEKTPESDHDFARDPIQLKYEGDWVTAEGTTLGADNGIALAVATVLAEDNASVHPPLELLFTVDEESGLIGAKTLDPDIFEGKILLNIDSEEDGEFTVGCAGGQDTRIRLALGMSPPPAGFQHFDLAVHGLRGGHSGIDIHKHRASANKLLARALHAAHKAADMRIVSLRGGTVHNAIARDATARIACDPDGSKRLKAVITDIEQTLQSEFSASEPTLALTFDPVDTHGESALSAEDTLKVVHLLLAMPHGVAGMSADIEGLVETSNNLATVDLSDQGLSVLSSQRSSISSRLGEITARIKAITSLAGARISGENSYPPWQPDMDSLLLKRCHSVYVDLFNKEPLVRSIHAGLECGIIGSKTTGMDMISFGPTIRYPHSPEEKLHIPSIIRIWDFINQLLASYTE